MRGWQVVALAWAGLVVAGCGSSSGGGTTVTVTSGASTAPATSAASSVPDAGEELQAYLEEMAPIQRKWDGLDRAYKAAVADLNTTGPDESWTTAADRLEAVREMADQVAVDAEAISPPAAAAKAHAAWAQSAQLASVQVDEVRSILAAKDVSRLIQFSQGAGEDRQARSVELRVRWRTLITALAKRDDVALPSWVAHVGERTS